MIQLAHTHMNIHCIHDNQGKTVDRYTIVTNDNRLELDNNHESVVRLYEALGVSTNPTDYMGFSQWTEVVDGTHLGKEITFEDLPQDVQDHIQERLLEL